MGRNPSVNSHYVLILDPEAAILALTWIQTEAAVTPVTQLEDREDRQHEEREDRLHTAPCTAEIAECTCPEFCERDHDFD